jgi:hypothetical protein
MGVQKLYSQEDKRAAFSLSNCSLDGYRNASHQYASEWRQTRQGILQPDHAQPLFAAAKELLEDGPL